METENGRLNRQFDFILEIDKLKKIERQNILTDGSRRENSAEHSWHLAMLAIILTEHSPQNIDLLKVIKMLLIHDIVEIDAGDGLLHDPEEKKQQYLKEKSAAERIFSILPEDQMGDLKSLWHEFEEGASNEAKFAKSLDRVQPALLHEATGSVIWKKYGTTHKQVLSRMKEVKQNTPMLWPRVSTIIDNALENRQIE
jgi:putative hydrolases of HD superfamily